MRYDHAVLGESLELYRDEVNWFATEKERLEKSKKVRKEVSENIQPMVEQNEKIDSSDKMKRKSGE